MSQKTPVVRSCGQLDTYAHVFDTLGEERIEPDALIADARAKSAE